MLSTVSSSATVNPFKPTSLKYFNEQKLLLTHHIYIPDIAVDQSTPRLQLFTNGLVILSYPEYMKKSGEYRSWLGQEELQKLTLLISTFKEPESKISRGQVMPNGMIVHNISSAEKFNIIRHNINQEQGLVSENVPQIVMKSNGQKLNQEANELIDSLDALAQQIYSLNK